MLPFSHLILLILAVLNFCLLFYEVLNRFDKLDNRLNEIEDLILQDEPEEKNAFHSEV